MNLIDRDKVCFACESGMNSIEGFCDTAGKEVCVVTRAEVVDAVPVVRCRDCKNVTKESRGTDTLRCKKFAAFVMDADFCSYGERCE